MRAHDVLEVDAAVEQLVDLEVGVGVGGADVVAVVLLGEEARRAQDQARQAVVAVDELAQVLGGGLGGAVDVARDRRDVLGDPRRGRARRRRERAAERARRAGEDEARRAGRDRLLEQVQRAGDVGVDELRAACASRRAACAASRRGATASAPSHRARARARGRRSSRRRCVYGDVEDVEPDDLVALRAEHAHERLAEVTGASGDAAVARANKASGRTCRGVRVAP